MTIRSGILANVMDWLGASRAQLAVAPDGKGAPSASYADNDLNSFAMAAIEVRRISNVYTQKMESVESEPELDQLERQANGEMVNAVRKEGLTIDKYQDIASRLETDPELAERVKEKLRKVA